MMMLVLGLLLLSLAVSTWRSGRTREATMRELGVVFAAPAAMLLLLLAFAPEKATRFRTALLGLGFRTPDERALVVEIAGRPEAPEIRPADPTQASSPDDLPALGWIRYEARRSGAGSGAPAADTASGHRPPQVLVLEAAPGNPAGLLGVQVGKAIRPVLSIQLDDGDRIVISGRTWAVMQGWPFGVPTLVDGEGRRVEIPLRQGRLPLDLSALPILRPLKITQGTYPLAWLDAIGDAQEEGALMSRLRPPTAGLNRGFFFLEPSGLVRRTLWLCAPDGSVSIERDGTRLKIPSRVELQPGQRVHLLSPPRWNGRSQLAVGVRDRRSFRVHPGEQSLALIYDTPELHSVAMSELEDLRVGDDRSGDDARVHLTFGDWQGTDRSLHFQHVPNAVAIDALATLAISSRHLGIRKEMWLSTPTGSRRAESGRPVWLGGNRGFVAVQFDWLRPPLLLGMLSLLLAGLKIVAAHAGRMAISTALVAGAVEGLLALRILIAYRSAATAPLQQEPLMLALAAWAVIPWSILVASLPPLAADSSPASAREPERWARRNGVASLMARQWLPGLVGWAFSLGWCVRFGGGGVKPFVWISLHAAALAVPLLRNDPLRRPLVAAVRRCGSALSRHLAWWCLLPVLFTAGRLLFSMVGWRERISIGDTPFAISLLHVPLAVVFQACYLAWLRDSSENARADRWPNHLPGLAIVLGIWVAPAFIVSDLGLALLNVPVFLLAHAFVSLGWRTGRTYRASRSPHRLPRNAPAVALALVLAAVAMPLLLKGIIAVVPEGWLAAQESERNYLRLLGFAYPDKLRQVARRESEELAVMSAVMQKYTAGPLLGRGYFGSEISPHIRSTALREHAPAVFVAAEWGLAGTTALIVLYAVIGIAATARGSGRHGPQRSVGALHAPTVRSVAHLAGLTLAIPSIYMILANYGMTLFTGKNAYLLGIDSTADVLEVWLIAVMMAASLSWTRDTETQR